MATLKFNCNSAHRQRQVLPIYLCFPVVSRQRASLSKYKYYLKKIYYCIQEVLHGAVGGIRGISVYLPFLVKASSTCGTVMFLPLRALVKTRATGAVEQASSAACPLSPNNGRIPSVGHYSSSWLFNFGSSEQTLRAQTSFWARQDLLADIWLQYTRSCVVPSPWSCWFGGLRSGPTNNIC